MRISVELSEEQAGRLRAIAERLGVKPEDLARAGVADLLRLPGEDFERAAETWTALFLVLSVCVETG